MSTATEMAPEPSALRSHLQAFLRRELVLRGGRFVRDLDEGPTDAVARAKAFHPRVTEHRIFAELNRIAAETGFDARYDETLNVSLEARGFSPHERAKIAQRMDNGYIRGLAQADGRGVGVPSSIYVAELVASYGRDPTDDAFAAEAMRGLCRVKAKVEDQYGVLYQQAIHDPEGARAKVAAHAAKFDADGTPTDWPPLQSAMADAVEASAITVSEIEPGARAGNTEAGGQGYFLVRPKRDEVPGGFGSLTSDERLEGHEAADPVAELALRSTALSPLKPEPFRRTGALEGWSDVREAQWAPDFEQIPFLTHHHIKPARDDDSSLPLLVSRMVLQRRMEAKTAKQYRLVVFLMRAIAGSDDMNDISQQHIAKFRTLLSIMPRNWGKSSRDQHVSAADFEARGRQLLASAETRSKAGLSPATINRYLTQLGVVIEFAAVSGFDIGDANKIKTLRPTDNETDDDKAPAFSEHEIRLLLGHPLWSKSTDPNKLYGGIAKSIYWIVLLGIYTFARLSEICYLRPCDVDPVRGTISIVPTDVRRLKNDQSKRVIPIHPELIRLGFLQFVAEMQHKSSNLLFQDLRDRGSKADLGGLFSSEFNKILAEAFGPGWIRKTFKSFRKTGNSLLTVTLGDPNVRLKLMGHMVDSVNARHYMDEDLILPAKIVMINSFPALSKDVQRIF